MAVGCLQAGASRGVEIFIRAEESFRGILRRQGDRPLHIGVGDFVGHLLVERMLRI